MEEILKYTGIGGLAISLFATIVRLLLKKISFSKLGRNESYKILKISIISLLILSTLCLIIYFFLQNRRGNALSHHSMRDVNISGNSNIILNGNITTTSQDKGTLEFVDQPDSLFYDYLLEHEGKNIYIQHIIPVYDMGGEETFQPVGDRLYRVGVKNVKYEFLDNNVQGHYMKGELKKVEMDLLWPLNKSSILSEDNLYTDQRGVEHLTIDINKEQEGSVYYNRGEITLKGYFRPYYTIGGQGYNFLTLKSN
ncbi:hypothetical protein CLU97_0850 [Chryseobacterium sp. 7]|uniref:hypothetical protein n=1 Tax=Chryseobacterium sp. 7 TaxID=2035214 RepID=UPI000EB278B7|nr:hypothetical protein [Chryseobacterium sp. 7]RLJ31432.1 hypothetical protein CLU97_0850 [Chryseobacterium sp. 7]